MLTDDEGLELRSSRDVEETAINFIDQSTIKYFTQVFSIPSMVMFRA